MLDVEDYLGRVRAQVDMMRITAKLMQSAEDGKKFELGSHGPILLVTFANMMHSMADDIQENLKDLDLAISIKGHQKP
jgi:hypothetical protein